MKKKMTNEKIAHQVWNEIRKSYLNNLPDTENGICKVWAKQRSAEILKQVFMQLSIAKQERLYAHGKLCKRVCAWCQKTMGYKEGSGVTHGICEECAEKEIEGVR